MSTAGERPKDDRRNPYYLGDGITNSLGLKHNSAKGVLKAFALTNPVAYSAMRNNVYETVLETMVTTNYEIIWKLLSAGEYGGKIIFETIEKDGKIKPWSPQLPDHHIGKIANAFSESTIEAFQQIMGEIIPSEYKDLAEERQIQINKITGTA